MRKLLLLILFLPGVAMAEDFDSYTNVTTLPTTCEFAVNDPVAGAMRNVACSALDSVLGEHIIQSYCYALSSETADLETGTKLTVRAPFALDLTDVRASATTAPTGSGITIDINEGGTTILSTKLTLDATEKTSTTAATAAVISDSSIADDAEITFDFDGVGSTLTGAGVKVCLYGTKQ